MDFQSRSLSVRRQCDLLDLNRSTLYYEPVEVPAIDLELMRIIDEVHLERPFLGSRRMMLDLRNFGHNVNRKRVQRLMRIMGLEGMAPGPSTSRPHPQNIIYPYLLRNLEITRANQVWASDITYIPMRHGFLYLVAIMDWYSRFVLSFRISNTLDTSFCVGALEDAINRYGTPEIFNTDQGAQFTAEEFTEVLKAANVAISMDGKGRWQDNVFVERLWRSLKYEEVYLKAYDDGREAQKGIDGWFNYYNGARPHQSLGNKTPSAIYWTSRRKRAA